MSSLKLRNFKPTKFYSLFIIILALLVIIYSPYFVINLPLFKIQRIEINTSSAGKQKIQEILKKDFENSWLFLLFNKPKFVETLERLSNYGVKNAEIKVSSILKGEIKINLIYRKPFASLNNRQFLGTEGIIFGNSIFKNFNRPKLVIELKNLNYHFGDKFTAEDLNLLRKNIETFKADRVILDKFSIYYINSTAAIKSSKGRKLEDMNKLLTELKSFGKNTFLNLETDKFFFAKKIVKERSQ